MLLASTLMFYMLPYKPDPGPHELEVALDTARATQATAEDAAATPTLPPLPGGRT
jgi:hypothetical protein